MAKNHSSGAEHLPKLSLNFCNCIYYSSLESFNLLKSTLINHVERWWGSRRRRICRQNAWASMVYNC
ncbi:hypothetical protein KPH14_011740 [Odynerus spinipes]|uniref:Uncharacterized protein n=1 Tax=Odynerus spinipes TaxID=1348599 RepID=A0AAD9RWT4_9HYME|nr:hypothetical protein KPH14_011740 [Odynerus spinipes]